MIKYYLGIDGGGSKTHCALFNESGRLVDFLNWGTTSHEFLEGGYKRLNSELNEMFSAIASRNALDWGQVQLVYGMAGVDSQKQKEYISSMIEGCGLKNFLLCNDSYLGIMAASPEGWGICSMNGSGTGAGGIDKYGNMQMVGGLFELSGDMSGGRLIGESAIRRVYDHLFRQANETSLTDAILNKIGARNGFEFVEQIVFATSSNQLHTKDFAPLVFEAASKGDKVANTILEKAAKQNALDIISVANHLGFERGTNAPVVLLGSLYTKISDNKMVEFLKKELSSSEYTFELIMLETQPVVGAVCWAMKLCGVKANKIKMIEEIDNNH